MLEKAGDPAWPLRAAEERSPDAGKKRIVDDTVRNLQSEYDRWDTDTSGTAWWKCTEAARFDINTYKWDRGRGWEGFSAEMSVDIDELNNTVNTEANSPP